MGIPVFYTRSSRDNDPIGDPVTGYFGGLQPEITASTWYQIRALFSASTDEVFWYRDGVLIYSHSVAAFTGLDSLDFFFRCGFGSDVSGGKTATYYLDNVSAGVGSFGDTTILGDDFEAYTLASEWLNASTHGQWGSAGGGGSNGIHSYDLGDITVVNRPFNGSGKCLKFIKNNEAGGSHQDGGIYYFNWNSGAGTIDDIYVQFDLAFEQDVIDHLITDDMQLPSEVFDGDQYNAGPADTVDFIGLITISPTAGKLHYFHAGSWHRVKDA